MSNDLMLNEVNNMWTAKDQVAEIKRIYAHNLTDGEFMTFVNIGKAAQLNPFKREIWAVKYDNNKPANIFIGRDGYRTIISRNPNYDYHITDAVYENDEYSVNIMNNEFVHKPNFKNRGALIGAYCLVKMKSASRPFYVFCELHEYNLGQSIWKTKPATMIKKVSESQCIRMAMPLELAGTYSEVEIDEKKLALKENKSLGNEAVRAAISDAIREGVNVSACEADVITVNESDFGVARDMLEKSNDEEDLSLFLEFIADADISDDQKNTLRNSYKMKLAQIKENV